MHYAVAAKWLHFVLKVAKLTPSEKWEINSAIKHLERESRR